MTIYGIPGVGGLLIGAEDGFNQPPEEIAHWYGLRPFDYTRMNPKRAFVPLDGQLRNDVGPGGGIAGLHQQVDGSLSLWAHPSNVTVPTLASLVPWESYLDVVFGAFGMPQESCNGEPSGVSYNAATKTIVMPYGVASDYTPGSLIAAIDDDGSKNWAFVVDARQVDASVELTLDRDIGVTSLQGFSGGYVYRCDGGDMSRLSTQDTGGELRTFALDQQDIGSQTRQQFSGCVGSKLGLAVDKENRLMLTAGFKSHRAVDEPATVTADTPWPEPECIQVHNWDVCINGVHIANVASVSFECEYTVQPVSDVCGDQGRSGYIITGLNPVLKLTALNDGSWNDVADWFDNGTPLRIGIVFQSEQQPVPGGAMGLWLPNAQLMDPHAVEDGDLQFRNLECVARHGSVLHSDGAASLGHFAIAFG